MRQLRLFEDHHPEVDETKSLPLVVVPGTTWRFEIRALWCSLAHRGIVAMEVTDDDTRELIHWQLAPGADSFEQLVKLLRIALADGVTTLDQLDAPF